MAHAVTVTDESFVTDVVESDVPVLVDFWASWCAPCKMIAPLVEELAAEYEGRIRVAKVDIDANPATPGQFGIMSIPTLLLFKDGKAERRITGYVPKGKLKAEIETLLSSAPAA